jgi:hypothetical protein
MCSCETVCSNHDEKDMKARDMRQKAKKKQDSYLSDIPVVYAKKTKDSITISNATPPTGNPPAEQPIRRHKSKPKFVGEAANEDLHDLDSVSVEPRGISKKPPIGSKPSVRPSGDPGSADAETLPQKETYLQRQGARREMLAKARQEAAAASGSPTKGYSPLDSRAAHIPKRAVDKRKIVDGAIILPRLVQSDQTEKRAAHARKPAGSHIIASRDDSESDLDSHNQVRRDDL